MLANVISNSVFPAVSVNTTSYMLKRVWPAANTTYTEWIKSNCDLLWKTRVLKYLIMKYISHIYCDWTNVRNDHPHACTDTRTYLIIKKHLRVQSEGCFWRMLYRCEATFGPFCTRYHTFSLHRPAVYKLAVTSGLAASVKTSYTMTSECDRKKSL
jgi:hypothetical protein